MTQFTVASAQYDISFFASWEDYVAKLTRWVSQAAAENAKLLVFPEYGSMELASLFGEKVYSDLQLQLHAMQTLLPQWRKLHEQLAKQFDLVIVACSFPVEQTDGSFRNRSFVFGAQGLLGYQDKLIMTRFENELWHIHPGDTAKIIDTPLGRIGINICYDSEFPMIANTQIAAGADLLLVPSCTDTQAGFYRVRIGCQARALENQCYVIQSPTVGNASWSEAVDVNTGRASVYTPVDYGFPSNGILAQGDEDYVGWVYASLDLDEIARIREQGQVFNYRDWPRQFAVITPKS